MCTHRQSTLEDQATKQNGNSHSPECITSGCANISKYPTLQIPCGKRHLFSGIHIICKDLHTLKFSLHKKMQVINGSSYKVISAIANHLHSLETSYAMSGNNVLLPLLKIISTVSINAIGLKAQGVESVCGNIKVCNKHGEIQCTVWKCKVAKKPFFVSVSGIVYLNKSQDKVSCKFMCDMKFCKQ